MTAKTDSAQATIIWRRLDLPGHDTAQLRAAGDRWQIDGVAVFAESGVGCCLRYAVVADSRWHTVSARVRGWKGDDDIDLDIAVDARRRWTLNGIPAPAAAGCIDIDLAFSPATNLLPVRRLGLSVGESRAAPAAWLTFPALAIARLDQTYSRLGDLQYGYESSGGAFRTTLTFLPSGLVAEYPGLWSSAAAQS